MKTGSWLGTGSWWWWCSVLDLGVAIDGVFASGGAPGSGLLVWGVVGCVEAELVVWMFGCRRVGGCAGGGGVYLMV